MPSSEPLEPMRLPAGQISIELGHTNRYRQSRTIAEAFDPTKNSFGFIRIALAFLVLVDHAFPLGGFHHGSDPMWGWTHGQESFGGLAVAGFFVLSGFLVTRSFVGSVGPISYLWKRILRIFPGFWVCLIITTAIFAPIAYAVQFHTWSGYLRTGTDGPLGYIVNNWYLVMHQYNIEGLLRATPYQHSGYPQAFDGSLWTLIYEFKCYIGIGVLGMFGIFRRARVIAVGATVIFWIAQIENSLHPTRLHGWPLIGDTNMARLAFLFSLGTLLYLYREHIVISNTLAALALVVLVVGMRTDLYVGVGQVALAYLCLWLAIRLPLHGVDRFGDFSYGLYIYAFPVEQLLALSHVQRFGLVPYILCSFFAALVLAVPSWFLIEKRSLRLKRLRLDFLRVRPSPPSEHDPACQPRRRGAAINTGRQAASRS